MTIRKNHDAMPKTQARQGCPPDDQPRFLPLLADKIMGARDDDKPTAHGTRLRHSDAAKCARALSLGLAGFPREPIDAAGRHVMALGEHLHEQFQSALVERYGDSADVEVTCQVDGLDASGHIDAVIVVAGRTIAYELKSTGGFGFKLAVGERGTAEGPRHSAVVQGALNALAVNADAMVIGMVATEAISKPAAARKSIGGLGRFVAEWTYTRDQYEPIGRGEAARMQRILDLADGGTLAPTAIPDPEIPHAARVVDPQSGRWEVRDDGRVVDTGSTWMCGYCAYQPVCAAIGDAGPVPVAHAAEAVGAVSDDA